MTYESERDAISRQPIWLLKMTLDSCSMLNPSIGAWPNKYSLNFDGVDQHVNTNYSTNLAGANAFSLFTWYKDPTGALTGDKYISCMERDPSATLFILGHTNGGLYYRGASATATISGSDSIYDGAWHQIGFTYDGADVILYIDGSAVGAAVTVGTSDSKAGSTIRIMADRAGTAQFASGRQDEYTLWDVKLTPTEITELYNSGTPFDLINHSKYASLVQWLRMGDGDRMHGSGPFVLTDFSASGIDGVTSNIDDDDKVKDTPTGTGHATYQNECNATEGCRYTWPTCKDTASFDQDTRIYKFTNRGAFVKGARPLLRNVTHLPIKIDSKKFRTEVGQMTFKLADDDALYFSDPHKNIGSYSQTDTGRYWPNFIARNANYKNRIAELYKGFKGLAEDDFVLEFRGNIFDIDFDKAGVKIIVRDLLWKAADAKFPNKIPKDVVTDDDPLTAGATTLNLDDGGGAYVAATHFELPTVNQPRCIKIEDEYITYTGYPTDQLTGCTRGAYGTTAAEHAKGTEIQQVTVYSEDDSASWSGCTGVLADHVAMDLLCYYAEIDKDHIRTVDYSLTLDGAINASVTSITLNSILGLPETGAIRINDEWMHYTAISGLILTVKRGMYRSTAASHLNGDSVLVTTFTDALGKDRPNVPMKERYENQYAVNEKIKTWSQSLLCSVWPNEDGQIQAKIQSPPRGDSYKTLTEAVIIDKSKKVKRQELSRITRCDVWFDPRNPDPSANPKGDEEDYYFKMKEYVDAEAETSVSYGDKVTKSIFAEWLSEFVDADWLSGHYWTKYRDGTPILDGAVELQDEDSKVGDLIRLTVDEIVDEDGIPVPKFYFIISKLRSGINKIKVMLEQAGFGDESYRSIGPVNGVLDTGINDSVTTFDMDVSGSDLVITDFRTGGVQQVYIEDEKITYTTVADQGGSVLRFSGCTRGVDGTSKVAHSGAVDIRMLYSAASDTHRLDYAFIGSTGDPPTGNKLDSSGDFTENEAGSLIW